MLYNYTVILWSFMSKWGFVMGIKGLEYVSFFSGGGGLDLGLEAVGFESLLVTDIDEHSCKSLENNKARSKSRQKPFLRYAKVLRSDITELSGRDVLELVGKKPGELALLAGGPPCQAFSVFGKRKGLDDHRGQLAYHYLRMVAEIQPESFLFENVYGILTIEKGKVFEELCHKLSEPSPGIHYEISVHRVNAMDFGVPQSRDRVFVFGNRKYKKIPAPTATHTSNPQMALDSFLLPYRTVRDALCGLPVMGEGGLENHTGRKHSDRIKERYALLSPGERDPKTRINRLDLNRPSHTIIVGSDAGGGKGHVHPTEPREVTPRESARMQTFPDWWAFSGTSRHPIRQIGNAVPPILGAVMGNLMRKHYWGLEEIPMHTIVDVLDQTHLYERELFSESEVVSS
ncbi:DNA (cytosine-5)-methyltransferase 1 [Marinobacterium halophilum]|uniref:DNA (cytosine-5-)-methyltransferase n=2 Tax=Marinobacterium halophilum TaxID=267374 RepID=A0A2P8EIA0_9GAMM|nr:DNA (cytosine-5)-methyltransferase 1 [Marinobacterium halophilum]